MAGAIAGAMEKGRDGKGKGAGDVEHTEILGGVALGGQHVDDEREVDGRVRAGAEPADGQADQEAAILPARSSPPAHGRARRLLAASRGSARTVDRPMLPVTAARAATRPGRRGLDP
jgi:hypothetical protein